MNDQGKWRRVVLETPFMPKGKTAEERDEDQRRKLDYARRCMHDCIQRREAPFASHLLYTQPLVLDDNDPAERELGINAGFAWGLVADVSVVYTDLDISSGMKLGIAAAEAAGRPVEYRTLAGYASELRKLG